MTATRRIRLDLAYDGTDFHGWQRQPRQRTVQGAVEQALARLQGGRATAVRGAGRTDAGVHARGQVADAAIAIDLDDGGLLHALRSLLPEDVRPLAAATVESGFNARRDARSKTYTYGLDLTPAGDPFRARYALPHPWPIDERRLSRALELLPGRRDWSGFCASACDIEDRVRTLTEASFRRCTPVSATFTFSADGFLTHMVRILVGTLLDVARGRFAPERLLRVLDSGDRRQAGPTAPARGLCLERVRYRDAAPSALV